jgi:hypothetical protein
MTGGFGVLRSIDVAVKSQKKRTTRRLRVRLTGVVDASKVPSVQAIRTCRPHCVTPRRSLHLSWKNAAIMAESACAQLRARLSDYFDCDIEADVALALECHLRECASCAEFAQSLRWSIALCHGHESPLKPRPLDTEAHWQLEQAWRKTLASSKNPPPK